MDAVRGKALPIIGIQPHGRKFRMSLRFLIKREKDLMASKLR